MRNDRFKKGSGCYTCRACGKQTRDVNREEGQAGLCAACYDLAGWENTHSDEGHGPSNPDPNCPICRQSAGLTSDA